VLILPRAPLRRTLLLVSLILISNVRGGWFEATAGLPLIETVDTNSINPNDDKWTVIEDRYGRLFTSDYQVHLFDGQNWHTLPVPGTDAVRTLTFDHEHRLWVGGFNEIGYFEELSLGNFRYHSLTDQLPAHSRAPGHIWACAIVEKNVYFICDQTVVRWDGRNFHTWDFPTASRLYPIKFEDELWFHHLESGLHRLTAEGPTLEIVASELPTLGISGLAREGDVLLVVSAQGFFRSGEPTRPFFTEELNQRIRAARLTSFALLPNRHYALGTVNEGLLLIGPHGEIRKITEGPHGLPARLVLSLNVDSRGRLWGTAHNSIFSFDTSGHTTVFDSRNGLEGRTVRDLRAIHGAIHAVNLTKISRLVPSAEKGAFFEPVPIPSKAYLQIEPHRDGFLASRFGGLDLVTPSRVIPVLDNSTQSMYHTLASRHQPGEILIVGTRTLQKAVLVGDGGYEHQLLAAVPGGSNSFHEEAGGRIWLSTPNKGIFTFDRTTRQLSPFSTTPNRRGREGPSLVVGHQSGCFLFTAGSVYHTDADGSAPRLIEQVPTFEPVAARAAPDGRTVYVAFMRRGANHLPTQGFASLTLSDSNIVRWQEFDATPLRSAGMITALEITEEKQRDLLWASGSGGIVRVELATLAPPQRPSTPIIQTSHPLSDDANQDGPEFPFDSHHLKFAAHSGNFHEGQGWLYQWRFSDQEWPAPTQRNRYELTNLSEGRHHFQVRAISPAGLTSDIAEYSFRILPPWYRSLWAYGTYGLLAIAATAGLIHIRERRNRARTTELENLVKVRTQELEKASAAQDEFFATFSHEIRNPMNGIIGIADSIPVANLDAESRHQFGLLRQCANHLSSLLEEVLDFSRGQAAIADLELHPFDLYELIHSVVAITESESAQRGIPVETAISPGVPQSVTGDARRIRQILLNLVGNALKFAGRGKIELTVWGKSLDRDRTELFFAVMDEGHGIARDEHDIIFRRFERGQNARTHRTPGTGLGLPYSKALAEKMGGRIWLESEPGHGACFYFSAPFSIARPLLAIKPAMSEAAHFPVPTALVVDDAEYNRAALSELLHTLGFHVDCVADGPSALTYSQRRVYGVIFLDYQLLGMSGAATARAIRSSGGKSSASLIVATTAFTTAEKRAECLASGMNTFLAKPVTAQRLRIALATLLSPETIPPPEPTSEPPFNDPLRNLRLIATSQGRSLRDQVELFFSELMVEHGHLVAAIHHTDTLRTCLYAHHLYGRSSLVGAKALENTLRNLEAAAAISDWATVEELVEELPDELNHLRRRLCSDPNLNVPSA
jgi:signal transduction histidine kinase/ActR/RegA family two-component response regulator